ncbi:S8 family serine peptidase [Meiothermus ruber]|jgi:subtilisin family serine protease|uniref:Peptidase S8 and S53 subtilisin kexin sedolisin n=1 Tax=Meiothermus ruber (strain ATCC 35948 / DSM 1279 / VKM B-1258 / 21) TaxID=504728 RepID=D3PRG7_MEIRD|nr:S8 family serine peptidase [Meiothermus ruber]ADD28050.1 peptidase S8 and S53 subtilisin kexin sedolisin [Meiothermus ruber DSM 1279]AGK04520.1 peptidase S8 and S53 subtilisin kexin sedolisin [Meiothermus ruber DSM 1279]MCL6528762.1 S8 family serine peptidase [Meiothermus ruber]
MRRYPVLILLSALLVGCGSNGALVSAIPKEVVLEGLEGSLVLPVGSNVAWKIESYSTWLSVTPQAGIGPKVVQIRAEFADGIQEQPEYTGSLRLTGDLEAEVLVRLPLVKVTGGVVDSSLTAASVSGAPLASQSLPSQSAPAPSAASNEILVKYRTDLRAAVLPQGSRVLSHDRISRITKLRAANPEALLQRLRLDPSVEWAEINGTVRAQGEPTDQYYPQQWHLRSTGARFTYLQNYTTPITVAVVDSGVRYDHPDLAGRLWRPGEGAYDFVGDAAPPDNPADPYDPCGAPAPDTLGDDDPTDPCDLNGTTGGSHGTHVTGLIVANSGSFAPPCANCSASGVVGMAYNAPVKVLPLRVLDSGGSGTFENVALAVRYAAGIPVELGGQLVQNPHPAQVINLSLGSINYSNAMCEAVADVVARGVLVVAAAGNFQNRNPGALVYPAACPGAISVAATDMYNQVAYYSQQNGEVDIAAPGGNTTQPGGGVLSTTWNYQTNLPNYTFYMGTSQAAPQVAAALAMVLSSGRATNAEEAWNLIRSSATDLGAPGRDNAYGYGLLNLPGAFGWTLPRGELLVSLSGPIARRVPVVNGRFETFLLPGRYTLVACRDDSGNSLCDSGEPQVERQVQVNGGNTLDLGIIQIGSQ